MKRNFIIFGIVVFVGIFMSQRSVFLNNTEKNIDRTDHNGAGPAMPCNNVELMVNSKKIRHSNLKSLADCFDTDIKSLHDQQLLSSKIQWLMRTEGNDTAEKLVLHSLEVLDEHKYLYEAMAHINIRKKQWTEALFYLDTMEVAVNNDLRILVEGHLGQFSNGTDPRLIPAVFSVDSFQRSPVSTAGASTFELKRISDGNVNNINGEPAMATSSNGQNIWLSWTESGLPTSISGDDYYWWRVKSAQSTDAGHTWQYIDMTPFPSIVERFHFDPMVISDNENDIMYAGLALKGFSGVGGSSNENDGFYMYRWDLLTDEVNGPFETTGIGFVDKGWLTVKDGDIYRTHATGLDLSSDMAENFTVQSEYGSFFNSYHNINPHDNDCLFITDINRVVTCDTNGNVLSIARNFSSINLPFEYFANDGDVPGTFRVAISIQNDIHPNGEIFVVYADIDPQGVINGTTDIALYMVKSSDNGMTWSLPWIISSHAGSDKMIPWVEIDDLGGIHVVYFDTRHGQQNDTSEIAELDLYYQYSDDLGLSWQETRITPTSLTTPDLIWGDYFFSDYISMNVINDHINIAFPWSDTQGQMHMYFAQKPFNVSDEIFINGFE